MPHILRNGNLAADLATLPRCGARTRAGTPCRRIGNKRNGRCRLHGGASTGPRTPEGRARVRAASFRHGIYTEASEHLRRFMRAMIASRDKLVLFPEAPTRRRRPCRENRRFGQAHDAKAVVGKTPGASANPTSEDS